MTLTFATPLWLSKLSDQATLSLRSARKQTRPQAIFRLFKSRNAQQLAPGSSRFNDLPTRKSDEAFGATQSATFEMFSALGTRPDPDIVLVLGASGLLGREIVKELLEKPGCIVVACVRSRSEGRDAGLEEIALRVSQRRKDSDLGLRPAKLKILVADLSTEISYITEQAKKHCIGAVVFAASGGRDSKPGEIDNLAVRALVTALEPCLGAKGEARDLPIFDFQGNASEALAAFRSVDDRVMGGVSSSQMMVMPDGDAILFCGTVTTANNGGFAQARGNFGTDENGQSLRVDLSNYAGIMIRCRGDGRRYKINLKDQEQPEKVFQASFGTIEGKWQAVRLPFSDFIPVRRGRVAYRDGPGSEIYDSVLDSANVVSVGIVVSKIEAGVGLTHGFQSGPFALEVSRITAYRVSAPRFLLVSSAAVTRPFWSKEKKALAPSAVEIPIVKLNPSNILGHKLAGENAVRRGTIPWAIIRPTGLNDRVPSRRKLFLRQGDTLTGTLSRHDAARGVVSALRTTASTWKTCELGAHDGRKDEENALAEGQFAALHKDILESQYGEETDHLTKLSSDETPSTRQLP